MAQNNDSNPKKGALLSANVPPCEGAELYTCQNGVNVGKRYYAIRRNVNGKYTSVFLGWVDQPAPSLKERVEMEADAVEKLKKDVEKLKKKVKEIKKGVVDSD